MIQQTLMATECATCGGPLPYAGVGRPRKFCDGCRPAWFPPLKEVNRTTSVEPRARLGDPETSHVAARNAAVTAGNNRGLALLALVDAGQRGLNDFELAAVTGKAQTSIGCRRKELVTLGLVERAPIHPRPSPSGSPSIVWRATPEGIAKARTIRDAS